MHILRPRLTHHSITSLFIIECSFEACAPACSWFDQLTFFPFSFLTFSTTPLRRMARSIAQMPKWTPKMTIVSPTIWGTRPLKWNTRYIVEENELWNSTWTTRQDPPAGRWVAAKGTRSCIWSRCQSTVRFVWSSRLQKQTMQLSLWKRRI